MSHIKRTNQSKRSGYFTVPESKNKVREISQPVKITQLLKTSQNAEKNSIAREMSKPERLTFYVKSSGKKNDSIAREMSKPERLTPYVKSRGKKNDSIAREMSKPERLTSYVKSSGKQNATNICTTVSCGERNVRRNLDFTETLVASKTLAHNITEKLFKEKEKSRLSRKSFLLPPNSIKDMHIKNSLKQKKPVSQSNVKTKYGNTYLKTIKESKCHLSVMRNSNTRTKSVMCGTSNKTSVIQYTSSQTINVINDQSGINILPSPNSDHTNLSTNRVKEITDLNHDGSVLNVSNEENCNVATNVDLSDLSDLSSPYMMNTEKMHEIQSMNTEQITRLSKNICKDLDLSLQIVKSINALCAISEFNIGNKEYVLLSKTAFTDLISQVKLLVSRLEEDTSNLKPILTTNSPMSKKINGIGEDILKEPCETQHISDSSKLSKTLLQENTTEVRLLSCNKENKEKLDLLSAKQYKSKCQPRRRSARLMAKSLNHLDIANDSFVNLENEVYSPKSETSLASPGNYTPVQINADKAKVKNKKGGRALEEYMTLKSRMSCLVTPNIKRFNSESKAHPKSESTKTLLSKKVLVELNNLYIDSPNEL